MSNGSIDINQEIVKGRIYYFCEFLGIAQEINYIKISFLNFISSKNRTKNRNMYRKLFVLEFSLYVEYSYDKDSNPSGSQEEKGIHLFHFELHTQ